jgi:hypothetical protein
MATLSMPKEPKTTIYQRVSDAFPGKAISVVEYELGHSKLANRGIIVPHIGVKVQITTAKGNFAVAAMVPETASDADITQLVGRLKADVLKHEDILTPKVAI